MHIQIESEILKSVLDMVSRVSTKHITLPILQCVLLEAKGKTLTLTATNLEIGMEGSLPGIVTKEGTVAVSAQTLLQTIALIPQKTIILQTEGEVLLVESGSSKTKIKTVPTDEFPTIPKIKSKGQVINGRLFAEGIKTTAFAASQSSIKPELGSIYIFQKKEHSTTFVATDSFRLIEKTTPQKGVTLDHPLLIPFKNALEIARVLDQGEKETTLFINENQCAFLVGDIYITSRLTTGTFPDYEQIIPKEYVLHTTTLTYDVAHALKKTNIFLNKFMQVTLIVKKNALIFSSESSDAGTTEETIPASSEGEELTLSFNQRYLSEVLQHIADESITMHFAGIGRPMVLEGVHNSTLKYLVMPMNK